MFPLHLPDFPALFFSSRPVSTPFFKNNVTNKTHPPEVGQASLFFFPFHRVGRAFSFSSFEDIWSFLFFLYTFLLLLCDVLSRISGVYPSYLCLPPSPPPQKVACVLLCSSVPPLFPDAFILLFFIVALKTSDQSFIAPARRLQDFVPFQTLSQPLRFAPMCSSRAQPLFESGACSKAFYTNPDVFPPKTSLSKRSFRGRTFLLLIPPPFFLR